MPTLLFLILLKIHHSTRLRNGYRAEGLAVSAVSSIPSHTLDEAAHKNELRLAVPSCHGRRHIR